jgi:hypothetical protein
MAESTLTLGWSDLIAEVGDFLGYGRTSGNWATAQTTHVESMVHSGYRLFLYHPVVPKYPAHEWSFLYPVTTLTVNAEYNTGTIAYDHTGGANELQVTLTTGTWPSWAASGKIKISGLKYDVNTRVSDSIITLTSSSNPGADVAASTAYTLTQEDYTLPDAFGSIMGDFTYDPNDGYASIKEIGEGAIRSKRQNDTGSTRPQYFAIRAMSSDQTAGQKFEAMFWPAPNAAYVLSYRYRAYPDKLSTSAAYHLGGSDHSECILEACLAKCEIALDDGFGHHFKQFMMLLEAAVERDGNRGPENFGYNGDASDGHGRASRGAQEARYVRYNDTIY